MTGSSVIDDQLQGVVNLLTRDFILTWHSHLTHHDTFIKHFERAMQQTCISVANR